MKKTSETTDPILKAYLDRIEAATAQIVAAKLAPIIRDLTQATKAKSSVIDVQPAIEPPSDRFVTMTEACELLRINRTTMLRRERQGKVPRRKEFPDGRTRWLKSQWDEWIASAKEHKPDPAKSAELAARLH